MEAPSKRNNESQDSEETELLQKEDRDRNRTLKQRLSLARLRLAKLPKPDFSRVLRPDFPRFFHHIRNGVILSCVKVEQDDEGLTENLVVEGRGMELGLRRSSLNFFKRKHIVCQHPYHPYTPKQFTRFVWHVND